MTQLDSPLEGLRLLDLGRYQAGPRCALMFARMGAEVIKVESITGDESRRNGPRVRGQSAYWVQYNSGKKSLAINLRTDEGKNVLRDLVKESDFFLQNFRPGTIDIMGFGYDEISKLNPKIIMINVSAYGQYGPYRDRVGFDPIGQAMGGLMSLTRLPGRPAGADILPADRPDHRASRDYRRAGRAKGEGDIRPGPGARPVSRGHRVHRERDTDLRVPRRRVRAAPRWQRQRHRRHVQDKGRLDHHSCDQRFDVAAAE